MSRFKIVYQEGGAVGNRLVAYIEAETVEDVQYQFYMTHGYGCSIESITIVDNEESVNDQD